MRYQKYEQEQNGANDLHNWFKKKKKSNKQMIKVLNEVHATKSYFFVLFSPDSCHGDKWPPESFTDAFAKRGWKFIRVLLHVLFKNITWKKVLKNYLYF